MASTIKLKNGSGAPLAADLVTAEPALDLTNKRLYTEDSGGTVIEVGTNPTSLTSGDITVTGTITSSGEISANGGIALGDNDKATFGASDDLQIYHDGLHSVIKDAGTGYLKIGLSDQGTAIQNTAGNNLLVTDATDVSLRHNGSEVFTTTSTGIDVTGTVTADGATFNGNITIDRGATASNPRITFDQDLLSGSNFIEVDRSSNNFVLKLNTQNKLQVDDNGDVSLYEDTGTTAKFFWDAANEYLGIGTTPGYTLDVENATDNGIARFTSGDADVFIVLADSGTTGAGNRIGAISDDMYFKTASTERMRIDANGNVGIGTSSPQSKLHVAATGNMGARIDSTNGGIVSLGFWAGGSSKAGITANRAATNLCFDVDSSEAMRIDSSGNLLVGTTDTFVADNTSGNGLSYRAGIGDLGVAGTNTTPLYANRIGNDGGIVEFRKDGATVGSIGSRSSGTALQIYTSNTGIDFGGDGILPMVGSTITDASRDIGSSSYRFKDLYLSGGVYLGGTGAANHLDDYEEGTWTPQFNDDGGGGDFASSGVTAKYTKVGRLVTIHLWVNGVTNSGSVSISGNLKLDDLPFTCDAGVAGTSIIRARNISSGEVFRAEVSQSTTSIIFYKDSTETRAATSDLLFANGGTNDRVIITLSYLAA